IGTPRHVHWQLARTPHPDDLQGRYRWRTDARIAPGGYFDDLASHGLNLFSHFFGDVVQVAGASANQQGIYSARDAVAASWRYHSGITGSGSWHFGS
ncbi:Gfo/Idh/MocA family protein, partial [Lactococcus lactis]